jgi:hypothetical protein
MIECGGGVGAPAGVNRRGLNYCAARSDEPVETLALRKLPDRSGTFATATDRWDGGEMIFNQLEIDCWIERE